MGLRRTKRNEYLSTDDTDSHRYFFSAFSASLRFVIFVGVPHGPTAHQEE